MVVGVRNFFRGISWSQIIAGALAAVTSFLLSAKIGIAGSVIGVAIGSMVSAVASQIYQNMLRTSSRKVQSVVPLAGSVSDGRKTSAVGDGGAPMDAARSALMVPGVEDSAGANDDVNADADVRDALADSMHAGSIRGNGIRGNDGHRDGVREGGMHKRVVQVDAARGGGDVPADDCVTVDDGVPAGGWHCRESARRVASRGRISPDHAVATTGKSDAVMPESGIGVHFRSGRRAALIVAVVSALLAVAVSAGIVLVLTRGQGTDSVVRDMVNPPALPPEPGGGSAGNGDGGVPSVPGGGNSDTVRPDGSADDGAGQKAGDGSSSGDGVSRDDGTGKGAPSDGSTGDGGSDDADSDRAGSGTGGDANGAGDGTAGGGVEGSGGKDGGSGTVSKDGGADSVPPRS